MRPSVAVPLVALALLGVLRTALARERLAVLVSVAGDRELADNLTEVIISKLSSASHHELVGQRELSERLLELDAFARGGLVACIEEPRCLAGVGAAAKAKLAVIGSIQEHERHFSIEFSLVEMPTSLRQTVALDTTSKDTAELIATVQDGVDRLFPAVPTDPKSAGAGTVGENGSELRSARGVHTKTLIAYAAAGAALLVFSAAIVTNAIARGRARNRLLIAAAAFGVAAGVAYLWR